VTDPIDAERERLAKIIRQAGGQISGSHFFESDFRAEIEYTADGDPYFRAGLIQGSQQCRNDCI
jgi:hypothetical protein